jgi:flagellar protein FliS
MFTSVSHRSASVYKRVHIETSVEIATPHEMVSLLFVELRKTLLKAGLEIKNNNIPAKCQLISQAIRILEEGLIAPLNTEDGGELALNLKDLYSYSVRSLIQANALNDASQVEEVLKLVDTVADGWNQIKGKV